MKKTKKKAVKNKRLAAMYPENVPIAYADEGGVVRYSDGTNLNGSGTGGNQNTAGANLLPVFERTANPIAPGFMPGFMGEYDYFTGGNPTATE